VAANGADGEAARSVCAATGSSSAGVVGPRARSDPTRGTLGAEAVAVAAAAAAPAAVAAAAVAAAAVATDTMTMTR